MAGITSLSITDSGFGYTTAPNVTISLPDLPATNATATANLSNDFVSSITINDSGAFYINVPSVTFSPPVGGRVDAGSIVSTGVGHINGTIYDTTGGSGTGFRIRSTASGGLTSFTIFAAGKNYVVGDEVQTDTQYPATIRIDSINAGTTALGTAVLDSDAGGRVSSITIDLVGVGYDSNDGITITIDSADGTAQDFRAQAGTTIDGDGRIDSLFIVDSGAGYLTAPTVTIDKAPALGVSNNDPAIQTLSSGVKINGEIVKYSDSDGKLHLAHVGADDGLYHNFVVGRDIVVGPSNAQIARDVKSVTELNKISETEQNDDFNTITDDFLDFTENNPFGDPS